MKAKLKAIELSMPDFHDFLVFLESFGVFYSLDFVFWSFEVKKAATQGQITKSQRSKKKDQKLVS